MSHFSVLVVGDDVEGILERYDENKEVERYIDKSAEEVQEVFKKHKIECYANRSVGEQLSAFDAKTLTMDHVTAEWWKEWDGQDLDEDGNAISTYNPDSKWDWYTVGGRWMGQLILKKGKKGDLGRPGVFNNKPVHDADSARIGDVDWEKMKKNAEKHAAETWDDIITPSQETKDWFTQEYIDTRKTEHLNTYGTKKEYVRRRGYWNTYALVTTDGWFTPGEVGFFGISSDKTEDRERFDKEFVRRLKSISTEITITVVDCHI